ncbi:putative tRNA pseudouridine synthase Pus10 [Boothiomyces sp. JEL0866]|nr:putative tRNA pseudouridine synthase Pus10 [Boothiomyces sp. JEL0866]
MNLLAKLALKNPLHEKIASSCVSAGCCFNCVTRYLGIRNQQKDLAEFPPVYESVSNKKQKTEKVKDKDADVQQSDIRPCPTCLGLLQLNFQQLGSDSMHLLDKEQYSPLKSFNLSIQLPVQLTIRHKSMVVYLKNQMDNQSSPSKSPNKQDLPEPLEVKEVFKYLLKHAFSTASKLPFDVNSPFSLQLEITHNESVMDYEFMTALPHSKFNVKISKKRGRTVHQGASVDKINLALKNITEQDIINSNIYPPPVITTNSSLGISFNHSQLFVAGRYNKLERGISNSKWFVGSKRMAQDSMEELIGNYLTQAFQCSSYKFSSAGREDVDVLMLGRGRPFYFELINPHKLDAIGGVMDKINEGCDGKIRVWDLQLVTKDNTSIMKDSASTKSKSYKCLVKCSSKVLWETVEKVNEMREIELKQQNPTRVPRRADLIRDKMIETIRIAKWKDGEIENGDIEENQEIMVYMKTSAGTYVKEFVHGDGGRTKPCLGDLLGAECSRILPTAPDDRTEYEEFQRLLNQDVGPGNEHGWKIKIDWPKEGFRNNFQMRVCLRQHFETGNPNNLLRADGKFQKVKPQDFLDYLLNPANLPGLQEWKDVEELPDGGYIKYCRVKAPGLAARDHVWRYTIDKRDDGSVFVCIRTTTHDAYPELPGVIRAYYYNSTLLSMSKDDPSVMTMTEFIFQDLRGGLPAWLLNAALPIGTIKTNENEMKSILGK